MLCKKCGKDLPENVKFCPSCGHRIYETIPYAETEKVIKRKNILLITFLLIILILAGTVIYLTFFKPGSTETPDITDITDITDNTGISEQTESDEPEITTIEGAYESALGKLKLKTDAAPKTGKAEDYNNIYGEVNKIDTTLTEQELTALSNYNRPSYNAVKNVQIQINPDNTVNFSADIDKNYFIDDVLSKNDDSNKIAQSFPLLIFMPNTVNVTCTMSAEIEDNKTSDFNVTKATVMGIGIPESMYSTPEMKTQIITSLNSYLAENTEKTGAYFDTIKVQDGELIVKGDIPSSLTREPVN
ncbi:MAG: zinc ribbon domain-containing protein [Eubacteriales bacterium]